MSRQAKIGRDTDTASIHKIAQGRVWTGLQAKEIGLVDVIGGIDDAIALAAEAANLEKYRIKDYPEQKKDKMQELLQGFMVQMKKNLIRDELKGTYKYYQQIQYLLDMDNLQYRLPYSFTIN
ncbi:MAG: S49 family peptidase [Bacteroidetes bacterium]|nr:S49 family peptidase [Bacteroidota bacterium]